MIDLRQRLYGYTNVLNRDGRGVRSPLDAPRNLTLVGPIRMRPTAGAAFAL